MHFKEIYRSACCSNYVCVPCALAHITQRLNLSSDLHRMPVGPILGVCCPSCNTENVTLIPVQLERGEKPRNYQESPQTRDMLAIVERKAKQQTAADTADDKENLPVVRAISFTQNHQKILNFESAREEEETQLETNNNAHPITATALPPRPTRQAVGTNPPPNVRTTNATPATPAPPAATIPPIQPLITITPLSTITAQADMPVVPSATPVCPSILHPATGVESELTSLLPPMPDANDEIEITTTTTNTDVQLQSQRTIRIIPIARAIHA